MSDMLDPADPPSPLTARQAADLAFEVHKPDLRGACERDRLSWPCETAALAIMVIEALDAARAPDADPPSPDLRAAAADVLARFGGYGRGYWSDEDEDALVALRTALASSPAPAGLDVDRGIAAIAGHSCPQCRKSAIKRGKPRAATRPAEPSITINEYGRAVCICGETVLRENWQNHKLRKDKRPHRAATRPAEDAGERP